MRSQGPVPIAIIGMGCRYPGGANSPEELWNVVSEGRSGWSDVPSDRFNHQAFYHPDPEIPGTINQKGGHFIDQDIATFDAGFFGIAQQEADTLDPQQRVVLETTWEAVENAGIPMHKFKGSDTGIFVAMFGHDFAQIIHKDPEAVSKYHNLGVARPLLANRVSYVFDLQGPSVMVDTACSGSLAAISLACQSLRSGETSTALAGGVNLVFSPDQMALMSMTGLFNDQGRSYTFDDRGNGYGRGEGVGMVILKRLDDAIRDGDSVRAIIRNSGINSDGRTNGIMLPNQDAQERLAKRLFQNLPFKPSDVQYVEAHGTGTKAGDKVEINTIRNVFCEDRDGQDPVFVGATKPNIGHSEAASGTAGLIKTVMAMEKGFIPPNILLENFKPGLEPDGQYMKIARSLTPWPTTPSTRKAVVNSFGFGGTNAMLLLESAHGYDGVTNHENGNAATENGTQNGTLNGNINGNTDMKKNGKTIPHFFPISARSEYSLQSAIKDLGEYLKRHPDVRLDHLSHTLVKRRSKFQWRSSIIAEDIDSLLQGLGAKDLARNKASNKLANAFVFTGQGAQWARMGYTLLQSEHTAFARSVAISEKLLKGFGAQWSLTEELSRDDSSSRLNNSEYGQPASTAVQIALVDLLKSWNVLPAAVVGHSSGEIAAAYAAGAISQSAAMFASYHRSFLAEKSKQRSDQSGTMMAVGLGNEDAQKYIEKFDIQGVTVACINSPSSVTVSGDLSGIVALKDALDADGVFNRRLKVDTAYHSHHMQLVSSDYLQELEGLESGPVDTAIRYFSSVTEQEKFDGFGASYWVDNLVSPVRFCGALRTLYRELRQSAVNIIEIGPHAALSSPIKQTLADLQADGSSYNYIPTLVRGENSIKSLMNTGSALFRSGNDHLDIGAVAALCRPKSSSLRVLRDLPSYHWNHTETHWMESRLSREYRCRKHPSHDLLGSRVIASPDSQPSWRILLSTERLPWLQDHVVDNFIVFPAAGYMTMAIQAIQQLDQDRRQDFKPKGYRIKNVSFKKTLTIPKDDTSVETILTFQYSDTNENWNFSVSSMSDQGKWQDHCNGTISAVFDNDKDEIEQQREAEFDRKSQASRLEDAAAACTNVISHKELYAQMAATGNQYGPSFAINNEVRMTAFQSLNDLVIPDIAAKMPSGYMQPHLIHPTTLDGIIQSCLPVFQQHSNKGSVMPIFISDIFISASIANQAGNHLQTLCNLSNVFPTSTNFSTAVFQTENNGTPQCVLTMNGGEIRVVGEAQSTEVLHNDNIFKMEWGVDSSSITPEMLERVQIPLQSDEAGITQAEKVNLTFVACARYIDWAVREMHERGLAVKDDHRVNWWRLLKNFVSSEMGKSLIEKSPSTKEELDKLTSRLGVEGEAVARIGPELVPLLTGQTDPLTHFLKDDLLFRVYHSDEGARPNQYMADYVKMLTFQRRDLRILEIGAGTGGTTYRILKACSPNGESFCSEYMYTDISSGFFEAVRTDRLKDWAHLLTFQTLDLEKDAASQGFKEQSYDLVVAANVVHATRSLNKSIRTIHKLLKPGGVLGLVELTTSTPYINMTFGSIPGWWAGVDEGRTDSPLQSAEQWNVHLQKAGFSGVDLAAYDLPEPERHCALLLSTALALPSATNGHVPSHFKILDAFADDESPSYNSFSVKFANGLTEKGFGASLEQWTNAEVNCSSSYIILDSAKQPLLTKASTEQFTSITRLLSKATKVYWVIFAANDDDGISPDNALITGVSRTARNENPHLDCFTIDVQDSLEQHADRIQNALLDFVHTTETRIRKNEPREFELMYRDGKMQIQRFVADNKLSKAVSTSSDVTETEETTFHQADRRLKIHVDKPGLLNSLVFIDDDSSTLGPDEVEIKSYAWGLNFSDVFIALGQLPPTQPMVGESAGIITAIGCNFASQFKLGDRVTAMFGTPYASRTRTNGHLVHRIPDNLSFTDAASIPLTFATAYYSLFDSANLRQGQTILIHSASGALGQVAIKIAQRLGATIFASVGSASKRQLLIEQYGIPESHIFSSRTTDFAAGVNRLTNGTGVDVVLNSLSGPMLHASWECVAAFGTFVEVGKTDISRRSQLSMKPFERNLRFMSVDLVGLSKQRPAECQKLLQRIFADFDAGLFTPLSVTAMPIGDIEKAFRLMQSRKHTGKIVLEATDSSTVEAKEQPFRLHSDGTYIIVGGLGSLGKHLCRHLQEKGARHIALFTRQSYQKVAKAEMEKELTAVPEATVRIITCDVGDAKMVQQVAAELSRSMPQVRGILHGGMVLSDRTLSQITQKDFEIALLPKYHGTVNIYNAFYHKDVDFFVNLSSLCGIVGTLGQSNYAAGGTYQDMFTHAQVSAGYTKFATIDFPLIKSTYTVTQEHTHSLGRQGVQLLPIETALPVVDYVMSGKAFKDGNHQIAFGLDPQSFINQTTPGGRVPPLVSHILSSHNRGPAHQTGQADERTAEEKVAVASTIEEAEQLILTAIREKIASLTVLESQELDLDQAVANMGLDSLVATEIKNWITNKLQAPAQTSDILDAPSLRSLASFVTKSSVLVKNKFKPEGINGHSETKADTNDDSNSVKQVSLPKYPMQTLEGTLEIFLDSVGHIANAEELSRTREAINAFQDPDGLGQKLQARLKNMSGGEGENNEVVDMYVRNKWLRGRDWRPRLRNFFATLPGQDTARQPQAQQAAQLSLAGYAYKLALDAGTIKQDFYHEQALDMATVYWLFSSNRTPALGCDGYDRFPESDYIIAMKRGHAYKIPLTGHNGQTVTYEKLKNVFEAIVQQTPEETNWTSLLTTANRDEWAKARDEILSASQSGRNYVKTVEESLFIIYLEDTAPETADGRADAFLLDDNSNRWLDKTLSFVVCRNGVSAIWGEHTMVDGTTFGGLIKALNSPAVEQVELSNGSTTSNSVLDGDFTYLEFTLPTTLSKIIPALQTQHQSAHDGYTLANLNQTSYAASYLRHQKLPPKTVIQLLIQVAVRRLFGYNPSGAVDVISQRPFRGGRTDMIYVMTPPVEAFCAAAEDSNISGVEKRRLFLEAVKSHARLVALSTRGRGFRWHLMALREMLEPGEELPIFYKDEVFRRTSERPVCTSFTEFGLPEMGRCQPHKEDVWVGVQVFDEKVQFTVINGERKSAEFVEHLKAAGEIVRGIIEAA
ncbi:beta-ketoacyl synthase domain-containing protein [Trichoderma gamsii]|uniref:Beta-ketoacyl synthase domain-containing protein n=1 Tax=Trichoderma gamsii TaxID=398673 RepID=A0A2P4ZXD6_9HYPO|nr:beta-ketoacyl synthase domain-containing protein [Trichoderma gamsii]PON28957.1 beta-ketoacyl synthase domain-containing protein [Trichoderma gamsii]